LAAAAVEQALGSTNQVIEAIGPETFTYLGLAQTVRRELGLKRLIVGVPPSLGYWSCRLLGLLVRDVIITREEVRGLMEGRLCVDAPPLGTTRLTDWIRKHRETLGQHYTSELSRRKNRTAVYPSN